MYGRIALVLTGLYLLLNILMLLRVSQKPTGQFPEDIDYLKVTLEKLLVTRHPGSPGHARVRDFLVNELQRLGFVIGRNNLLQGINNTNVVGFWNRQAEQFVVLTCHYDGPSPRKGQEKDVLVAATDGAVPCAIILNIAKILSSTQLRGVTNSTGLALAFLDRQESLVKDPVNKTSFHGSRHFVETEILGIELALTLNYIGAPNQVFLSHYDNTNKYHNQIVDIEWDLRKSGQLSDCHILFQKIKSYESDLSDDHVSFMEKDVAVLHIAPQKYPEVRHTAADNAENLHWPTILNMVKILRRFISDTLIRLDFVISENYDFSDDESSLNYV